MNVLIGDIHGCYREFMDLLAEVNPGIDDQVYLLGDVIDRGPNSPGVVRRCRLSGYKLILGNHEEKFQRWHRHRLAGNGNNPVQVHPDRVKEWEQFDDGDIEYLMSASPYLEFQPGWLAVHGGFDCNDIPLNKQDPKRMCRVTYVDEITGASVKVPLPQKLQAVDVPDNAVFWTKRWRRPFNVVYGHSVHSYTDPRVDTSESGYLMFGMDTGAPFGGRLSALVVNPGGGHYVRQVQARATYHKPRKVTNI